MQVIFIGFVLERNFKYINILMILKHIFSTKDVIS
jgi:hypothetical protein